MNHILYSNFREETSEDAWQFFMPMPAAFLDFTDYLIHLTKNSFESFSFVTRLDFGFLSAFVFLPQLGV